MAFNFNGTVSQDNQLNVSVQNRALNYGDGVFESIRFANNRINFWEDHYFRLMASMRILRMQIPSYFSPEYLEEQIRETLSASGLNKKAARVKILVFRNDGGLYTPSSNDISFLITTSELEDSKYVLNEEGLTVNLFLDYYKSKGLHVPTWDYVSVQHHTRYATLYGRDYGYGVVSFLSALESTAVFGTIFVSEIPESSIHLS